MPEKIFVTEASKPNEYPKVPKVAYCLVPLLVDIPEPTGAAHILYVMMAFAE